MATGRPFFGHAVKHKGPVLYVGAEDPAGFKVRLRAAKRAAGLDTQTVIGVYTFPEAIDLLDPAQVGRFEHFLATTAAERKYELIIGDTFAALTPGASENSSEDMTAAMVHAQRWRTSLKATVLLNHHTNATGSRERGHTAMRGAADFMIALTPVDDVVHVESSKQRNGPPFPTITLRLVPGPDGEGVVFRAASDVMADGTLSPPRPRCWPFCGRRSAPRARPRVNGSGPATTSRSAPSTARPRCSKSRATSSSSAPGSASLRRGTGCRDLLPIAWQQGGGYCHATAMALPRYCHGRSADLFPNCHYCHGAATLLPRSAPLLPSQMAV